MSLHKINMFIKSFKYLYIHIHMWRLKWTCEISHEIDYFWQLCSRVGMWLFIVHCWGIYRYQPIYFTKLKCTSDIYNEIDYFLQLCSRVCDCLVSAFRAGRYIMYIHISTSLLLQTKMNLWNMQWKRVVLSLYIYIYLPIYVLSHAGHAMGLKMCVMCYNRFLLFNTSEVMRYPGTS